MTVLWYLAELFQSHCWWRCSKPPHFIRIAWNLRTASTPTYTAQKHMRWHILPVSAVVSLPLMICISSLPLRVTKMTDLSSSTGHQVPALPAPWAMVGTPPPPILLSITADQVIEKQPYLFSRFFHYYVLCYK